MHLWAVILAAGKGSRLAAAGVVERKQFLEYRGRPLFWNAARTFARLPQVKGLVFVFPPEEHQRACAMLDACRRAEDLGVPILCAQGGARRQDSVASGLGALPSGSEGASHVLVHDGARPFVSAALTTRVIDALAAGDVATVPGLAVSDTIKQVDAQGLVQATPDRASLRAVQTPQGFDLAVLRGAHARAAAEGWDVTDDAMLIERTGEPVRIIEGEPGNVKITNPEDLALLTGQEEQDESASQTPRSGLPAQGWGYDVHKYTPDTDAPKARPMVLAGVPIPGAPFVLAHSDGDVLLHAVADAVLGAAGLGDIGEHFPDSDPQFDNAPSSVLLAEVLRRAREAGFVPVQADVTLICQVPRLAVHKPAIREGLATMLGLDPAWVNVKATTEEGLGFTGKKQGIKAVAVVAGLRAVKS